MAMCFRSVGCAKSRANTSPRMTAAARFCARGRTPRHVRPAEPGLVAVGADPSCGWIDAVAAGKPGVEHVPAALAGRRLDGAPGADRAPVGRNKIHVQAETLQQISGDLALRFCDRLV